MKLVLGTVLAAAALLAGSGVAQAEQALPQRTPVTAWADVNIRECPATSCKVFGVIKAGETVDAFCWTHGERIFDYGLVNEYWLMVSRQDGGRYLSSALYFKGDQRANLPIENYCGRA
ncbi:SH3 domain-containing protein [Lentzea sp. NPDC051213]|uniref:SH3 domain-containing protein n=1 Tax=Lentzea sp. NPDC051213 TaxID=3364126 RepID=UPI0037AE312F